MAVLYKKRHPHKTSAGKQSASEEPGIHDCPQCGNQSKLIEQHRDRSTYKCIKCNAISTFTNLPGKPNKKYKKKGPAPGIVVRDRSEKKAEEPEPVQTSDENTEAFSLNINTVNEGMVNTRKVSFEYIDTKGNRTVRDIEPYKLMKNRKGEIILYGFCKTSKGIRTFKLQRVFGVRLLDEVFEPRWAVENKLVDDGRKRKE